MPFRLERIPRTCPEALVVALLLHAGMWAGAAGICLCAGECTALEIVRGQHHKLCHHTDQRVQPTLLRQRWLADWSWMNDGMCALLEYWWCFVCPQIFKLFCDKASILTWWASIHQSTDWEMTRPFPPQFPNCYESKRKNERKKNLFVLGKLYKEASDSGWNFIRWNCALEEIWTRNSFDLKLCRFL